MLLQILSLHSVPLPLHTRITRPTVEYPPHQLLVLLQQVLSHSRVSLRGPFPQNIRRVAVKPPVQAILGANHDFAHLVQQADVLAAGALSV